MVMLANGVITPGEDQTATVNIEFSALDCIQELTKFSIHCSYIYTVVGLFN